ncbi:MAG: phosphoadenylyl-sulfate reductase [Hyphomicrobiales bacterium]
MPIADEQYAGLEGRELIEAIVRDFAGRTALVSSFGAESAVLLHMVSTVDPSLPVIFLDTGKLFWETRSYRSILIDRLGLTDVRSIAPDADDLARDDPQGDLHAIDPDLCCHIRKTLPLERATEGFDVLISGRKRFHGAGRAEIEPVNFDGTRLKVEPLARFTALDLKRYMEEHALPAHPLAEQGYRSIGCKPCTVAGGTDDDPRAGRWAGTAKTECGIHITQDGRLVRTIARG